VNRNDRRRLDKTGGAAGLGNGTTPKFGTGPTSVSARLMGEPVLAPMRVGPPLHLNQAAEHFEAGRLAEAEAICRQILDRTPAEAEAGFLLGVVLLRAGRRDEALPLLESAAVQLPKRAEPQYFLGLALTELGRHDQAIPALRRAVALRSAYLGAQYALGHALDRSGDFRAAAAAFETAAKLAPSEFEVLFRLANSLRRAGELDAALQAYRQAAMIDRQRQAVDFWIAALGGAPMPPHPPERHIVTLFDEYAEFYDRHQREQLRYQVPELLLAGAERLDLMPSLDILDAGCGTGLCGAAFRTFAGRIDGVDLSPRMLDRANARGGFDGLMRSDLVLAMRQAPERYDLILAGDVLPYIGDPRDLLAAAGFVLRPGGWFLFTTEAGEELALRPNGRYVHGPAQMAELAAATGLATAFAEPATLAQEFGAPCLGTLHALRRV